MRSAARWLGGARTDSFGLWVPSRVPVPLGNATSLAVVIIDDFSTGDDQPGETAGPDAQLTVTVGWHTIPSPIYCHLAGPERRYCENRLGIRAGDLLFGGVVEQQNGVVKTVLYSGASLRSRRQPPLPGPPRRPNCSRPILRRRPRSMPNCRWTSE